MASFFKKALSVFVEFEDEQQKSDTKTTPHLNVNVNTHVPNTQETHVEAEKFEKYFDNLFEKTNLPGPDYFEFYKTMETLEAHIFDEKARLSATYASLSIQGLTKDKLIDTANKYKAVIEQDQKNFETVLKDKLKEEVGARHSQLQGFEEKIKSNSDLIQKLTKEITEAQQQIGKLKHEVAEQENKLMKNKNGYQIACQALINKINSDIIKIQTTL
jgi:chromosome segregation ATPase